MNAPFLFLKNLLIFLLIIAFSGTAFSQSPPKKSGPAPAKKTAKASPAKWEQEPDSFMGIQLGKSLHEQIPECPLDEKYPGTFSKNYDRTKISKDGTRCLRIIAAGKLYEIENLPKLGFWIKNPSPLLGENETFEGMSFQLEKFNFGKAKELFFSRYGNPTETTIQRVQTRGGASFEGEEHIWSGQNVSIVLSEYGSRIDESSLFVYTKAYSAFQEKRKTDNAQRYKDGL